MAKIHDRNLTEHIAILLEKSSEAMNVILSPEFEKLIHEKVASGAYESADAVIEEALRLLRERDENGTPRKREPFWATATPAERARAFKQWASSHEGGPGLPSEALRRENIYD